MSPFYTIVETDKFLYMKLEIEVRLWSILTTAVDVCVCWLQRGRVDQTSSSVIMVAVSHHDGSATETMIVETCLTNRTVRSPLLGQVFILTPHVFLLSVTVISYRPITCRNMRLFQVPLWLLVGLFCISTSVPLSQLSMQVFCLS